MVQQNKIKYNGRMLHVPCHSNFIGARMFLLGCIATGTVYYFSEEEKRRQRQQRQQQ